MPLWFWETEYPEWARPWFAMWGDPQDDDGLILSGAGIWDDLGFAHWWITE